MDYEFEMKTSDLPAELEDEEELSRFRRLPSQSLVSRVNAPRSAPPRKPTYLRLIIGHRTYLSAPESPAATEYVRWVQMMLNQALNLQLPVDGVMSVQTRSAIRSFQEKNGLPVTRIVGLDTGRVMQSAGSSSPSEPSAPAVPTASAPPTEQEDFLDWFGWGDEAQIEDRTALTPKSKRVTTRDLKGVYALVLHQMAFNRGNDPKRYDSVTAHYAILPDGKIIQLHPISAYLEASNGFSSRSVAVDFAGNFPNTRGTCWEAKTHGCHKVTQAQIESGRKLVKHLIKTNGLTHVFAHRQSSGSRDNDPGPDIWYHVGQWAIGNLGLSDGGPGFRTGTGKPIPNLWRIWGQVKPQPELEFSDYESAVWFDQPEEVDLFLGKLVRDAGRAAKNVSRTAQQAAKAVGKTAAQVSRVVPLSQVADLASRMTPLGTVARAGWGGLSAGLKGQNILHGAARSVVSGPLNRFVFDTGLAVARGENITRAMRKAGQAGINDVREQLRFAEMVAPFVPGLGSGVAAALGAANALADGRPITEALIAAARSALPGGAATQGGFNLAMSLARGRNLSEAALAAARATLPGGPAAQAAFDVAVALGKGKRFQDAAFSAAGRALPPSPYAADALSFARSVAAGENVQSAALSWAGKRVLQRMQREA